MQRILNALLQFRNPILYFFLLGLSVSFTTKKSAFHEFNVQKYGFFFSSRLYAFKDAVGSYYNLKEINQQLLKENEQLKKINLSLEDIPLYPLTNNQPKRFPFKVKKANILKNSYQNQRNFLILDIGSENGVQPEMGVISNNGIIGVVHSVTKNYSNVISILHQDLKINVRTNKSPAFGSLVWSGKKSS
jgi:rod shape-determining protein MreC